MGGGGPRNIGTDESGAGRVDAGMSVGSHDEFCRYLHDCDLSFGG